MKSPENGIDVDGAMQAMACLSVHLHTSSVLLTTGTLISRLDIDAPASRCLAAELLLGELP